jgi:hypothetical protein
MKYKDLAISMLVLLLITDLYACASIPALNGYAAGGALTGGNITIH